MIPINAENGHFSKVVYVPEGYKETNKYITTQPLEGRKRGFGTKDAHRRDEFSNNIRTEQYREGIRKETVLMNQNRDQMEARLTQLLATKAMQTADFSQSGISNSNTMGNTFDYSNKVRIYSLL